MFKYELINPVLNLKIDKKFLNQIFEIINFLVKKKQNWTLNIVFVNNKEIKNLNKTYRKIDSTTDVLSFHYFDDFNNLKNDDIAWEIVISSEKVFSQAEEFEIKPEEEFYKLVIHSILHIIGYDHKTEKEYKIMQNLENKVYEKIWLNFLKINI